MFRKGKWQLMALMVLLSISLSAQTIHVERPNSSDHWAINSTQDITWRASGVESDDRFKITLFKGREQLGVIATELSSSTRSYSWPVARLLDGSNAPTGTGYKIKVKLMEKPVSGFSDPFEIIFQAMSTVLNPNDFEVESVAFRDFNNNHILMTSGVGQFPYGGGDTPGAAIVRVRHHPGIHVGHCKANLFLSWIYRCDGRRFLSPLFPLTFNSEHFATVRIPFTILAGLPTDSFINIKAEIIPNPKSCDHVRTNNSKEYNLNLRPFAGHDLTSRITNLKVSKVYGSSSRRWHFEFKIGVHNHGHEALANVNVRWRLMEDGSRQVFTHNYTIDRLNPGEWHDIRVNKYFGGTDRSRSVRPRLREGRQYVVSIHVDPGNGIAETNERNNQASRSVTLRK